MKKIHYIIISMMFLFSLRTEAETIRVPQQYPTIQAGLDAASLGDTVLVAPGRYNERLLIEREIALLGELGADSTTIHTSGLGGGQGSWVILVRANCTISGFTIKSDDPFTFGISSPLFSPVIENNIIAGLSYSGITCNQSAPTIRYNLIIGNVQNGIIMNTAAMPMIINNTIVGNRTGVAAFNDSNPLLKNNIIAGNNVGIISESNSISRNSYNDVWNDVANYQGGSRAGEGDISINPLFLGGQPHAYHLQPSSPCIDAGDPASPRDPDGTQADMGAYYFNQLTDAVHNYQNSLPRQFLLLQNHPNPFNPETVILYELPQTSQAEVTIFNLLGEQVRTLVNHRQAAGQHRLPWDGRDERGKAMPSGIYLYRLRVGEFVQTRKMMLMQ